MRPTRLTSRVTNTLPHTIVLTVQEFFKLVTPEQGEKTIAALRGVNKKTGKPRWFHFPCPTAAALADKVAQLSDRSIYYGLAGFTPGSIVDSLGRKQVNVQFLRALWLDIDIGEHASKYTTQDEALQAISVLSATLALTPPLIVSSGGGLHVYWPLSQDLPRELWKPLAQALKTKAQALGFKLDPARAADEASVLRPIGTLNHKFDPPRPVHVVDWVGVVSSYEQLAKALLDAPSTSPNLDAGVASATIASGSTLDSLGQLATDVKVFSRIIRKCSQMAYVVENMGNEGESRVIEPLWRAAISIVARCKNGEKHAHTLSRPYPSYKFEETQDYYVREFAKDMPATCSSFSSLRPEGCANCKYAGKFKSPIVLGIEYTELEAPVAVIESDSVEVSEEAQSHGFKVTRHELRIGGVNPPFPYKRTAQGLSLITRVPVVDGLGQTVKGQFVDEDRVFAPYDIYPLFRTQERHDGSETSRYSAYWRIAPSAHKTMTDDVQITHSDLASNDSLRRLMSDRAVYTPTDNQHKAIADYMRHYLQKLGAEHTHPQPTAFGWQKELSLDLPINEQIIEFVVGHTRYSRMKVDDEWVVQSNPIYPANNMTQFASHMKPKGTLEGWATAAHWYRDEFAGKQIAAVLLTFGSPFMCFLKKSGVITLLRGQTGIGKSGVLQLAASAWASNGYVIAGKSSYTGMETVAGTLNNLPVVCDDRPEMKDEEISAEILMLANGKSKTRARLGGGGISSVTTDHIISWLSNSLMSSNKSWIEILTRNKLEIEGETGRMIELEMTRVTREQWLSVGGDNSERDYNQLLATNHGVVGPAMIQEFLRDPAAYIEELHAIEFSIMQLCTAKAAAFEGHFRGVDPTNYRLQVAAFACALLALKILRKLNLVQWKRVTINKVMFDSISNTCRIINDGRPDKQDILAMYLNEFHGNLVIVTAEGVRLGSTTGDADPQMLGKLPVTKIVGRIDHTTQITYLDRAAFKFWINSKGMAESNVLSGLAAEGWIVKSARDTKITLGKGFSATSKLQSRVIELHNPKLFAQYAVPPTLKD